ncbi:MAG: ATP-binding cassette domain-containing protein [Lachnospiraceae bacterium]|nr:ATP-binding cassette domain-containing protein [Lachnospiraceae bacterium]MEE3460309.1 ATP-binding cassette domain-containing protein [Lachnospiraceae bacterium]
MNDVNLTYPNGTIALKHVSMQIRRGEFVFMVGSSGSGKSTLIKTLLGELRPTSGSIIVDKNDLGKITRKQLPYYRRKIGVVFQEFRLLEDRNVFENVELAQRVIGMNKTNRRENVKKVLKLVGLYGKRKSKVTELSGGEQQRVAIARAMVNKPLVLLADEPTGNLDPNNSWEIMKLLVELNKIGTTVLVVTHNDTMVNVMQQRVITLNKGVITNDEQGGYVQ